MNIKHMRLVLPARMRSNAQLDARIIAEAAAKALQGREAVQGPLRLDIQGQGRPARFLAQSVTTEVGRQTQSAKRRT